MPLHAIFFLMLAGGIVTSYAEYKFNYNLYTTIKTGFSYLKKLL